MGYGPVGTGLRLSGVEDVEAAGGLFGVPGVIVNIMAIGIGIGRIMRTMVGR